MERFMRHTLGAILNISHNLSSSKGPKPLQLKLLTPTYQRRAPLRLPLVPRNGCGRPGRAPERFLPLDITSRSEERFSRNAETDLVCRLLLEKKNDSCSLTSLLNSRVRRSCMPARSSVMSSISSFTSFFFNDTATTEIYTLSLHDALPISTYQRRAPLRLPLVPRNGCGRPGRAPERFLPLDITSLLLHVIFDARFLLRQ